MNNATPLWSFHLRSAFLFRATALLASICSWLWFGAEPAAWAQTVTYANRSLFQTAAPGATNTIDFQEYTLGTAQGTGFIGPITELGFVIFHTDTNFRHEVI